MDRPLPRPMVYMGRRVSDYKQGKHRGTMRLPAGTLGEGDRPMCRVTSTKGLEGETKASTASAVRLLAQFERARDRVQRVMCATTLSLLFLARERNVGNLHKRLSTLGAPAVHTVCSATPCVGRYAGMWRQQSFWIHVSQTLRRVCRGRR